MNTLLTITERIQRWREWGLSKTNQAVYESITTKFHKHPLNVQLFDEQSQSALETWEKTPEFSSPAAVLLLIDPGCRILFTTRSSSLRSYPNMVCLPGGGWDAGETLYETALRECEEEVGLSIPSSSLVCPLHSQVAYGRKIRPVQPWLSMPHDPACCRTSPHGLSEECSNHFWSSVLDLIHGAVDLQGDQRMLSDDVLESPHVTPRMTRERPLAFRLSGEHGTHHVVVGMTACLLGSFLDTLIA